MPRILFVCQVYPRRADDHQAAFMHDIARLAARDNEVVVLAPHDAGLPEREVRDGIEIRRFRYAPDDHEDLAYRGNMHEQVLGSPMRMIRFAGFLRTFRKAIRKAVADVRPDIVHFHWWIPGGMLGRSSCKRAGVPYVVTSHGTDVWMLRSVKAARRWARRVYHDAAGIHLVSSALRDEVADKLGGDIAERAVVWPMPVDVEAIRPGTRRRPRTILFVGRLVERKGVHVLLDAYRVLRMRGVDASLEIVGDGPDRGDLERQAGDLADVTFLGAVPRQALVDALRTATVLAFPSIRTRRGEAEGMPVVVLEAMAAGLPVAAADNGGTRDVVIDHLTGLLVPEDDASAMADALQTLLDDAGLRKRCAREALRRLDAFGHDATHARLEALYAQARQ